MFQQGVKISPNLQTGRLSTRKLTLWELVLSKNTNKTRESRVVSIVPDQKAKSLIEHNHLKSEDS